ncbi:MAG TPA: HsdR family type I site-specific deoxyribonuclease [Phycisphaerales bacterium]|nr:HsdR family type I site-specific deoxyribonuclease [Phycisphaerales bacterium]HMP36529.1 HsdR family type I site-specific deoxyribonuclease [Phycisphaerales bacterium]
MDEGTVELAALDWFQSLGYELRHGPAIAPGELDAERERFDEVLLEGRLRRSLARLNPELDLTEHDEAFGRVLRLDASDPLAANRMLHRMLVDGVSVERQRRDGSIGGGIVQLLDFDRPESNDWLVVNQFSVMSGATGGHSRRPDLVVFVNGLPLAVVELKNAANEQATIWSAFNQLQTYKAQIPRLFAYNAALVVSDGLAARMGTLTADRERFMPWRTIEGESPAPARLSQLEVLLRGAFEKRRFLDLLRHYIVFEDGGAGRVLKKMAGYHQFHAVQKAMDATLRATGLACGSPMAPKGRPQWTGRVVCTPGIEERYTTCVPMVPLAAAAGAFGASQHIDDAEFEWVSVESKRRLRPGMFVAQVVGRSMEPAIPDGAWCLFSAPVGGSREGKIVLVQLRDGVDPQTSARYTVKRYSSVRRESPGTGSWHHERIVLEAVNPQFDSIVPSPRDADDLQVVAELVEVLGVPLEEAAADRSSVPAASGPPSDDQRSEARRRVGVIWHTQGSGKSLTMAFYAGRLILHPAMENPTIVVLTDRNDLDNQLFGVFSRCSELLRQPPEQAADRADLRSRLARASGGVVFTTIQKFLPEERGDKHPVLSDRRNIVVIADEAHRSQYDFIDGFARHMRDALPQASFIGFTGTPIEKADANTRAVFGDCISVYDIQRAVEDGATVPIYYESRLAKLSLSAAERPSIDPGFEEATEGEEVEKKERLKTKWAQLEAIVGSEKRLKLIAADLVAHWERRLEDGMEGKAMIVCMSRRICVELCKEIATLRPAWHDAADDKGAMKVVMTGSASDPVEWQQHIRNKSRREDLAARFKDPKDGFRIVIVRDMWLTGFDAPCLHTMYVDKPMRGHGLMQAIARVNRVFRDKPGGLVVDYLGLAYELKQALAVYTESGGKGKAAIDQEEAVALMLAKHEVCCEIFAGFDRSAWTAGQAAERLSLLPAAQEHVLAKKDGKSAFLLAVKELSAAFALAVPHDEAIRIRDDVGFFQAVRAALTKSIAGQARSPEDIEHAIRQLVSRAVSSEEVVDIFAAAGLRKPDISILSEEFLAELRGMPHRNLAVELLRKLLAGEIRTRGRKNLVQARSFSEMLENAIKKYQNRAIEASQVIEELIALAKDIREADRRGEQLGMSQDEVAFYDALGVNDSAVKVLGEPTLQQIARELVESVRANTTIDWTVKESVRAKLRVIVKRILRKHGYPPDKQEKATQTVLEQAELLCGEHSAQAHDD